jgi:monoamine oxidase
MTLCGEKMKSCNVSDATLTKLAREVLMVDDNNQSLIPNYLNVMANGLPQPAPASANKVIIVGAGIAGLLAGKLLKQAGYQVRIIEANDSRVGGRIKTFHNTPTKKVFEAENQYAEAGAMRIPKSHPLVNAMIDQEGLGHLRQAFYNVDVSKEDASRKLFNTWYRTNEVQMRQCDYNANPPAPDPLGFPFDVEKYLHATTGQLLNHAYGEMNRLIDKKNAIAQQVEGWKKVIAENDNESVRDFLLKHFGENEVVMQYIGTLQNYTSRSFLSILHMFIDSFYINPDETYSELSGGNYQLPESLLKYFAEGEIVFNARAFDIVHDANGVKVKTVSEKQEALDGQSAHPPTLKHGLQEFEADLLLLTVPFSCQRFITVEPQLSYHKRRAIIELHYDTATKVVLEFSRRFWEWDEKEWNANNMGTPYRGHNSIGGGSVTDNPNRNMYFPSHKVEGSDGGVILASYTWADDAIRWDSIPDSDRYAYALRGLTDLYGEGIMQFFTGKGQTQSWMRDYYAMGEAAVFAPGQITELHPYIPGPEGNIFFAGEHTSLKHAWIEGALESAIRACLEINQYGAQVGANK